MNRYTSHIKRFATAVFVGLVLTAWAAPDTIPGEWQATFDQGVKSYRDGHFEKALDEFKTIVKEVPESVEGRYYFAISLAQLGRFKDAHKAYEKVIEMAPDTEIATLAQQGIQFLPCPDDIDAPPRFQKPAAAQGAMPDASDYVQSQVNPNGQQQAKGSMDADAMQMMMLMGSMGGGGGGFNPMMIPMMQKMMGGQNGGDPQNNIPPEVFSSMMMNQMMQDFNPFSSGKDD